MDGESTIQSCTKEMKIGDTITCINNQDSDSLELNEEYVVVDINEYGNIGVRHPASGSLLRHYYKPDRFKDRPVEEPLTYGQYFRHKQDGDVYILATIDRQYALIDIQDGVYWVPPTEQIDRVFYGQKEEFERVDVEIKIKNQH